MFCAILQRNEVFFMQDNNKKIGESPDQNQQGKPQKKNSDARIRANAKYNRKTYKQIKINVRPDQAEKIRDTAQRYHLSLAQLIITAVDYFNTNHQHQQENQHQHQPQHQQEQQEHTETQTADTQTAGDTTTTSSSRETETETENNFDWIDDLDDSDILPPSEMWERIAKHTEKTNKRLQEERQAERKRIKAEWDID